MQKTNNRLSKYLDVIYAIKRIEDKYKEFCYRRLPDEEFIKKKFKKRFGREPELENPKGYNDKLQWLKLNWYDPLAVKCADKYGVREYVAEKIGAQYLNQLYGVYESVDEIDLEELPKSFVLKATHGCGFNIICKDKTVMKWRKEYRRMRRWLKTNYFWKSREWVYKDIKPRIVCERFLEDKGTGQLLDYKIFCFEGEPKIIQVDFDRFKNHRRNLYDLDWNLLDVEIKYPRDNSVIIEKPDKLELLLDLSRKLSREFPHVRVDFYYVEGKIYFGELTFFHASGTGKFKPEEFDYVMGDWLKLPEKSK